MLPDIRIKSLKELISNWISKIILSVIRFVVYSLKGHNLRQKESVIAFWSSSIKTDLQFTKGGNNSLHGGFPKSGSLVFELKTWKQIGLNVWQVLSAPEIWKAGW